jgi:hypothetical protein
MRAQVYIVVSSIEWDLVLVDDQEHLAVLFQIYNRKYCFLDNFESLTSLPYAQSVKRTYESTCVPSHLLSVWRKLSSASVKLHSRRNRGAHPSRLY